MIYLAFYRGEGRPKNNSNNKAMLIAVGALVLIALIAVIVIAAN